MGTRRALHFVFKIGDRTKTAQFYRNVLGMKFLRHEEFEEGCKASCNGPYDGKWSKSMVGFGLEDNHFVVELTYNYGLGSYRLGTDFRGLTIMSKQAVQNAKETDSAATQEDGVTVVQSPDGYKFYLIDKDPSGEYWHKKLGMKVYEEKDKSITLGYSDNQCKLELVDIGEKVDHATAFGRIAFSCPTEELPGIESTMKADGETILTPLVSLDTPGKATVQVVILADPDGHEICFVGDEAFRELSQMDPKADQLLDEAMGADKSNEWFAKKGRTKAEAQ